MDYTDPAGRRAFGAYDRLGDPDRLEPADALAPALLDSPVPRRVVIDLFRSGDTAFTGLRKSMQRVLDGSTVDDPRFRELDLEEEAGPWELVRGVLR